jgi:hypothetical protein
LEPKLRTSSSRLKISSLGTNACCLIKKIPTLVTQEKGWVSSVWHRAGPPGIDLMDSVGPLLGEWRAVCLRETSKGKWPSEQSEGNEVPASFLLGGCLQATEWECFRSDSIKIKTDYGYHLGSTSWNCTVLRVFSLFSAQSPASRHKSHCS